MSVNGQADRIWEASTLDPRAPVVPGGAAATGWAGSTFTVDVGVGEAASRRVTLYALDWDNNNRSEKIEVIDADTKQVLDSRTLSDFDQGTYLSYNVTGDVKFRVTSLTAGNAMVLSGVFFDTVAARRVELW